ncbi:serine/threonine-protein kinase cx32, putative [Ricinus communis]|uniref:non-specific serine/threonine protein kinase n=1 Tax=Ricinus communis TaxID=3988 RepID=B9RMB0_RICCO|nr:serine/threonine-protein kinase cx32, putative [Ricinus communis]
MGICWSHSAHNPTSDQTNIDRVTAGDTSFVDDSVSGYSATSTNLMTWVSQSSTSFTTIWGGNVSNAMDGFTNGQFVTNPNLRAFSFAQMKAATHNFRRDMVVGKGGFGNVYKGWLKEKVPPGGIRKTAFAIKALNPTSTQGVQEWLAEVNFLGSLSHPNLVKLLGYCSDGGTYFLAYEFMKNGSLNRHLFGIRPLSWDTRLKIAIGTAQGLYYLHTLEKPVIYRDFKSSNILLDELYNSKISDFGLAYVAPLIADSHVTTRVMGTFGYMDPEYIATGHLYVKSDVYSFGVVLVEMLTGLRAIDKKRPTEQRVLVDWIKPHLVSRIKLRNIMDSKLDGRYPLKDALKIAHLAFRCLQHNPQLRPSMKEVAETLEQIEAASVRMAGWNIQSAEQHK